MLIMTNITTTGEGTATTMCRCGMVATWRVPDFTPWPDTVVCDQCVTRTAWTVTPERYPTPTVADRMRRVARKVRFWWATYQGWVRRTRNARWVS